MNIYVVVGLTGQYEDELQWNVRAFFSEDDADAFTAALNDFLMEKEWHRDHNDAAFHSIDAKECELDSRLKVVYPGTYYRVDEVPLGSLTS